MQLLEVESMVFVRQVLHQCVKPGAHASRCTTRLLTTTVAGPGLHHTALGGCFLPVTVPLFHYYSFIIHIIPAYNKTHMHTNMHTPPPPPPHTHARTQNREITPTHTSQRILRDALFVGDNQLALVRVEAHRRGNLVTTAEELLVIQV